MALAGQKKRNGTKSQAEQETTGVTTVIPRPGQRFVLVVRPLDWYAGSVGAGAVVEEVSDSAVYVLYDGGLRESFPPSRFTEYFRLEGSVPVGKNAAAGSDPLRASSGPLLHR